MTTLSALIESLDKPLHDLSAKERSNASKLIQTLIAEGDVHRSDTWAAHMTPAIATPALLGQLLAGLHSGNLLSSELYPHLATIEKQLLDWLCDVFQHNFGHFTHGSTYANLEALWQAREQSQQPSTIVYGSQAAHYSIIKACQILGLKFEALPTNEQGEMSIEALQQACQQHPPLAIVATAGTSSSGAIDPISSCIDIAKEFNCWCHVDAAWGGALMLTSQYQLLNGLADADSVCFDPHKALAQPRPCSVLLYQQAIENLDHVDYLTQAPKQTLLGSYGGELFLPLWCSLLLSGKETLVDQLNSRLEQAEQFYAALTKKTDWWLLNSATGIVCFRPTARSCDLSSLVQQGFLSRAQINDQAVYRAIFANHSTQAKTLLSRLEDYF